jgi:hypothetical protein
MVVLLPGLRRMVVLSSSSTAGRADGSQVPLMLRFMSQHRVQVDTFLQLAVAHHPQDLPRTASLRATVEDGAMDDIECKGDLA